MRSIIVLIWSLLLGQIVAYLGAALNHGTYLFDQALIASILIAVNVIIIGNVAKPKQSKTETK